MLTHDATQANHWPKHCEANQNRRQIEQEAVESAIDAVEHEGYLTTRPLSSITRIGIQELLDWSQAAGREIQSTHHYW